MARIEDYGIIGDLHTVALVSKDGAIDWLCLPRIDSRACFSALLGTPEHGRWRIAPRGAPRRVRRGYRDGTLILQTVTETADGAVRLTDCMPVRDQEANVARIVEGVRGRVPMRMEFSARFDYGSIVPWVRHREGSVWVIGGPDSLWLRTSTEVHGEDRHLVADFEVAEGERQEFLLTWQPSHLGPPVPVDPSAAVEQTEAWWRSWVERVNYQGPWRGAVVRSLITLKALTYQPTGGIAAAATTSLPEWPGGVRNWDYRYCWLRDATFTLYALLSSGCEEEAVAWREWLLRAVAGEPEQMQIMYGVAGERRIGEHELGWLPGFEGSRPVRVGNAAARQFQLDVYGEVMDALHLARLSGIPPSEDAWDLQRVLLDFLEGNWRRPDEGIWEVRGPRRHFTHSKVMAWVAADRAVKMVERFGARGPAPRWRKLRDEIHEEVCREGFNPERNAFTQWYGSDRLDASLLMMPLVGFLPASDPRVAGTVEAIERELTVDGFVRRYEPLPSVDGLPPGEGAFLPCSFWLVDNLARMGRAQEARWRFERLLDVRNDLGLLAEEYDPGSGRQLGNFPQAFSHVTLVNAARTLAGLSAGEARRET